MICYLSRQDILDINRRMTLEFGGHFSYLDDNVANNNSLEYLIEAPKATIMEYELYPTLFEKAAAYSYLIIRDHVFHDGNKRTGLEAAIFFLEQNGYETTAALTPRALVKLAISIAAGDLDITKIAAFLSKNFQKFPPSHPQR